MQHNLIRKVLETRFQSDFALQLPSVPVHFANTTFTTPQTPWVYVNVIPNKDKKASLGKATSEDFWLYGIINAQCMVRAGTGTEGLRAITDAVSKMLENRRTVVPPAGHVTTCDVDYRERGDINGWYTANVMAEYKAYARVTTAS